MYVNIQRIWDSIICVGLYEVCDRYTLTKMRRGEKNKREKRRGEEKKGREEE